MLALSLVLVLVLVLSVSAKLKPSVSFNVSAKSLVLALSLVLVLVGVSVKLQLKLKLSSMLPRFGLWLMAHIFLHGHIFVKPKALFKNTQHTDLIYIILLFIVLPSTYMSNLTQLRLNCKQSVAARVDVHIMW